MHTLVLVRTLTSDSQPEAAAEVPETEKAEADREKSPSWVPSYSVSSQGASPAHTPSVRSVELPEEPAPVEAAVSEPEPVAVVEVIAEPEAVTDAPAPEVVEVIEETAQPAAEPESEVIEAAEVAPEEPIVEVEEIEETPIPTIATEEVEAPEVGSFSTCLQ